VRPLTDSIQLDSAQSVADMLRGACAGRLIRASDGFPTVNRILEKSAAAQAFPPGE
jgi:hypothetical protein